ncbi:MAG TPA: hypothetical protein VMS22_18195 [Candidatus Eisenbacteria bacterium]|nr:hypothetical protein [Candidatus Eisenbacteria bacterium]
MSRFGIAIVCAAAGLVGWTPAAVVATPLSSRDESGVIRFVVPDDWRCTSSAGCVVCWNASGHPSGVMLPFGANGAPHARELDPGYGFELCPPGD